MTPCLPRCSRETETTFQWYFTQKHKLSKGVWCCLVKDCLWAGKVTEEVCLDPVDRLRAAIRCSPCASLACKLLFYCLVRPTQERFRNGNGIPQPSLNMSEILGGEGCQLEETVFTTFYIYLFI